MITIQLDYDAADEVIARVRKLLDATAMRDVDFNGAEFEIVRGDGSCVVDPGDRDPYDVLRLWRAIEAEMAGRRDFGPGFEGDSTGKYWETK